VFALFLQKFGSQPDFCCHGTYPYEGSEHDMTDDGGECRCHKRNTWLESRLLRRRHRTERITLGTGILQRVVDWTRLGWSRDVLSIVDLQGSALERANLLGLLTLEGLASLNVTDTGVSDVAGIAHMWKLAVRRNKCWSRLAVLTVGASVKVDPDWRELLQELPSIVYFEGGSRDAGGPGLDAPWTLLKGSSSVVQTMSLAYKHFWARSRLQCPGQRGQGVRAHVEYVMQTQRIQAGPVSAYVLGPLVDDSPLDQRRPVLGAHADQDVAEAASESATKRLGKTVDTRKRREMSAAHVGRIPTRRWHQLRFDAAGNPV
jgi:hypothetical protein